jgi:polyhydroxyalkanoate synthase
MKPETFPDTAIASTTSEADALRAAGEQMDETFQGWLSRYTSGLSPAGLAQMYAAWLSQLALCPGRVAELAAFPFVHASDDFSQAGGARDSRFSSELWQTWPWSQYVLNFRAAEAFWDRATTQIPGLSPENERGVNFAAHQVLNALSPANFMATNPEILAAALASGGKTLVMGAMHAFEDWQRQITGQPPAGMEKFKPGEAVAVTPGEVVFRNDLIELIQYAPTTESVAKEPILILPAWIMKFYILDLSPNNSLVHWLVGQGHTVFMVSWKNPSGDDRDKGMDEYVRDGALAALDAVTSIVPDAKVHLAGYCLGGTLAMIVAAWMAQAKDDRLQTLSLFAAQGDFTEAGEITVFVTDSEVAYLKAMMDAQGFLDTKQMAGAFQMLRSNDSIWSHGVRDYWLGERSPMFDLLAWNADATRMPCKMHSEYLERLFLDNQFADGHYSVLDTPIAPESITIPVFAVGTESDHVAPWKSVYKIHQMTTGDVTFALTNGGHNAGIVSEPDHPGRHYRLASRKLGEPYLAPDDWQKLAEAHDGSWWVSWEAWLQAEGTPDMIAAPADAGNTQYPAIADAPGDYVHLA